METRDDPHIYLKDATVTKRDVRGLVLTEMVFRPGVTIPAHSHEEAVFCLALQGGCTESFVGASREYTRQAVQFLPPDNLHSLTVHKTGLRSLVLRLPAEWLQLARVSANRYRRITSR
jgi:quercetin dioxygenase-like cupin family protein